MGALSAIESFALNQAVPIPSPGAQKPSAAYSPKVTLVLGPFTFEGPEVPEQINFGGAQMLAVHQLIGGDRIVDALGRNDDDITWKGLFFGQTASARAQYLDGLRITGKALTLKWGSFRYQVVIKSFKPEFKQTYQVPYTIVCTPVKDETKPVKKLAPYQVKGELNKQMATANALGGCLGNGVISSALSSLSSAIGAIPDAVSGIMGDVGAAASALTGAETCVAQISSGIQGAIADVLAPIEAAQTAVQGLLGQVNSAVGTFGTIASAVGLPGAQAAASIETTLSSVAQVGPINRLASVLGVMHSNAVMGAYGSFAASNDPTSPLYRVPLPNPYSSVTVGDGSLMDLASQHYGDASQWPLIAQANGMTDPQINGVQTIAIPQQPANAAATPPPSNTNLGAAPASGWNAVSEVAQGFSDAASVVPSVAQPSGAINAITSLFGSL